MEVSGKIKVINSTQEVNDSFKKRELVVTTEEQYPQHISIEFQQAKCDDLNSFKVGDSVKISINLRGREWVNPQGETKYFNTIQGWRIEKSLHPIQEKEKEQMTGFAPAQSFNEEEHDDLPF